MKIARFNVGKLKIGIVVSKITGFNELPSHLKTDTFQTFISTGPQGADGGENGYYVTNTVEEVEKILGLEEEL